MISDSDNSHNVLYRNEIFNPLTAILLILNFHTIEVVSR